MNAYVNGRFLTQPVTGVSRYAREVTRALEELAPERFTLLAPPDAQLDAGARGRRVGRLRGHAWEQLDLALAARHGILLSLGNTGPLALRRQLLVIHDASVFAYPFDFSRAFVWWYRALLPTMARRIARVVTVSDFSAGEIARYCHVDRRRIAVHYPGADHIAAALPDRTILGRLGLEPRSFVLAVGTGTRKGIDVVQRGVASLGPSAPRLVIVARARTTRAFRQRDHGTATVDVSDPELRALYEAALCLAYPSRYEGFGLPPLEAMLVGCPVVTTATSSLPEACGDAALFCEPGDPGSLAMAIQSLRSDEPLRARMIARGRDRAASFTWHRTAVGLLAELDAIAAAEGATTVRGTSATASRR